MILGISAVVAISTANYQNSQPNQITNSMEAQLDGKNIFTLIILQSLDFHL